MKKHTRRNPARAGVNSSFEEALDKVLKGVFFLSVNFSMPFEAYHRQADCQLIGHFSVKSKMYKTEMLVKSRYALRKIPESELPLKRNLDLASILYSGEGPTVSSTSTFELLALIAEYSKQLPVGRIFCVGIDEFMINDEGLPDKVCIEKSEEGVIFLKILPTEKVVFTNQDQFLLRVAR